MKNVDGFLFVELTENVLTDGRMIDALAAGEFTDMRGREVKVTVADLAEIVANTLENIEATRGESGELLGLPIDRVHSKSESYGYITNVELVGNVLRAAVRWTELGVAAIKKRLLPWFSATIDLQNKVLLGGGLTAWPATRSKKGKILLRPIELSAEDAATELQQIEFEDAAEDTAEVEATAATDTNTTPADAGEGAAPTSAAEGDVESKPLDIDGDIAMTKEEMSALVAEQVREALTAELQQLVTPPANGEGEGNDKPKFDILSLLDMSDAGEEVKKAYKEQMLAEREAWRQQAAMEVAEMTSRIKRESEIAEFTQTVTSGTNEVPYGLPVDAKDLQEFLGRLNHADLEFAKKLIGRLHREGRVAFRELGHGRQMQGGTPLPDYVAADLDSGKLTVTDLAELAPMLGDIKQYDLSRWVNNGGK